MTSSEPTVSAVSAPSGNTGSSVPRRAFAAAAILLLVYLAAKFLVRDALPFASGPSAVSEHYQPRWPWILTHVVGGGTALAAGAFQWFTRGRGKFRGIHRWTGRVYVAAVTIASCTALYLARYALPDLSFGIPLTFLAASWLAATWTAFVYIRRRNIALHRRWVARSYVLTLTFVFIRLAPSIPVWGPFGKWDAAAQGWICLILPLAILEWRLRRRVTI